MIIFCAVAIVTYIFIKKSKFYKLSYCLSGIIAFGLAIAVGVLNILFYFSAEKSVLLVLPLFVIAIWGLLMIIKQYIWPFLFKRQVVGTNNTLQQGVKNAYDRLKDLKQLLDDGIITQEEFDEKKKKYLDEI